jgi:hypothetical protein
LGKKLKRIYLFIVPFLLLLVTANSYCQSGNAQSLELGNEWIYFHDGGPSNNYYTYQEVIGDTILNNINYAVVKSNEFYSYKRADSNLVYYFDTLDSTENISLNYNWNIGDTVNPDPQNFSIVIDKSSTSIWGKTLRKICIQRSYLISSYSINWYTEWIGLTSGEGHIPGIFYTVTLLAANIENNIYGDTTLLAIDYNTNEILSDFRLYQNYPNPFNPSTTIKYSIPNAGNISLKVYDVLGKEIATLVNEEKSSGNYEVEFNASNLTSGIYFYQLKTGNFIETKKMILLR